MTSPRLRSAASLRARLRSRIDFRSWFAPGALLAIVLVSGALFWPSTQSLLHEWFSVPSSAYTHGALIVVISLWLAMRAIREEAAPAAPDSRAFLALSLLVLSSGAWLIALRAEIQVAHQALLPIIIWLNVRIVLGRRIAVLSLVPIGLLYSAIPIWHVAVAALQAMTVAVVSVLLRIAAIPAYVVGDFVHIRSGVFHIEDGCAGLHYFIVAVTIAAIFGELRNDRWRVRGYLIALAMALALASNWLRVFIIIVAGDLTDMQNYLVRVDHAAFGWFVFAAVMIVFLLLARRWPAHAPSPQVAVDRPAASALRVSAPLVLALLVLAMGPAWLQFAKVHAASGPNVAIPAAITGWAGPHEPCQGLWRPQYPGADRTLQREFSRGDETVCVYLASYLSQHQHKELIGFATSVYEPDSEVVATGVRAAAGRTVNEIQIGNETVADRIIWYAYVVGEREMRRGVYAQLSYALGTLHGTPAASIYAISAPCVPDCAAARRALTDFLPHVTVGKSVGAN